MCKRKLLLAIREESANLRALDLYIQFEVATSASCPDWHVLPQGYQGAGRVVWEKAVQKHAAALCDTRWRGSGFPSHPKRWPSLERIYTLLRLEKPPLPPKWPHLHFLAMICWQGEWKEAETPAIFACSLGTFTETKQRKYSNNKGGNVCLMILKYL